MSNQKCDVCGGSLEFFFNGTARCKFCKRTIAVSGVPLTDSKLVCPRCGSTVCDIQNNIFYCYDCGLEQGPPH